MQLQLILRTTWREQRGSHALEASGVAVGAALVAVALLMAVQLITLPGMQRTLDCAVAIVLGGSGCAGADGSGGGAGTQFGAATPSTSDAPNGARTAASIGLDVIPVVGEIKGLIEVFTGTDLVTGEDLGWWRFAGLAGLVGLNEIKLLRHGDEVVDLVRRGDELLDTGGDAARRADDVVPPCKIGALPTGRGAGLAAPIHGAGCRWQDVVPPKYQASVARAFDGTPTVETLTEDIIVYRHWGNKANEVGSPWFTPQPYARAEDARRYLALPDGNSAQHVSAFRIPAGTTILRGRVASMADEVSFGSYAVGGGTQIYLPDPRVAILTR